MSIHSSVNYAQTRTATSGNCKPQIDTVSLLNKISVQETLHIGTLYANCLPMPARKTQTAYEYNPYDGGKLSTVLKDAGGHTVSTFVWYGELISGLWELSRYEVLGGREALKKLAPGNYTLEFAVEGAVFQTLPFSLSTVQNKDPFNPKTIYLLDGLWHSYASLYAPNVDRFIQLTVWLRDTNNLGGEKPKPVPYRTRLIREKDKQLLAEGGDNSGMILAANWQAYALRFRRPNAEKTQDYAEFKLNEILANDGDYTIEVAVDGKPYADYKFAVKDGKINGLDPVQMHQERYRVIVPLTAQFSR